MTITPRSALDRVVRYRYHPIVDLISTGAHKFLPVENFRNDDHAGHRIDQRIRPNFSRRCAVARVGLATAAVVASLCLAGNGAAWGDWAQWGDLGNGRYRNPVLPADYSDLDAIRVGDDYYAISSTFQFSPGMAER
ncbi:hypothetical protein [Massilia putida]|uniref:hypothetical protein n=1 Tax=Massilia putida TaxID=1141883 RepID=UPI000A9BC66E|nr:hypothetical protein [Massilia putida]